MAEGDFQIHIGTTADTAGAQQAKGALDGVAGAAGKAAEAGSSIASKTEKLENSLGSAAQAGQGTKQVIDAIGQASRKGGVDVASLTTGVSGLIGVVRTFLTTAGPIGVALGAVAVLGGAILALKDSFGPAKESAEELEDRISKAKEAAEALGRERLESLKDSLDESAKAARRTREELEAAIDAAERKARADIDLARTQLEGRHQRGEITDADYEKQRINLDAQAAAADREREKARVAAAEGEMSALFVEAKNAADQAAAEAAKAKEAADEARARLDLQKQIKEANTAAIEKARGGGFDTEKSPEALRLAELRKQLDALGGELDEGIAKRTIEWAQSLKDASDTVAATLDARTQELASAVKRNEGRLDAIAHEQKVAEEKRADQLRTVREVAQKRAGEEKTQTDEKERQKSPAKPNEEPAPTEPSRVEQAEAKGLKPVEFEWLHDQANGSPRSAPRRPSTRGVIAASDATRSRASSAGMPPSALFGFGAEAIPTFDPAHPSAGAGTRPMQDAASRIAGETERLAGVVDKLGAAATKLAAAVSGSDRAIEHLDRRLSLAERRQANQRS